jgi:hypothetical protein
MSVSSVSVPRALFILSLWERLGEGPDEVGLATGSALNCDD